MAKEQDLAKDGHLVVAPNGFSILLLRRDGQVYAVGSHCPHLGCSIARDKVDRLMIVCPCHDRTFDIRNHDFSFAMEKTLPIS